MERQPRPKRSIRPNSSQMVIRVFSTNRFPDNASNRDRRKAGPGISVDHREEVRFMLAINHTRLRSHDTEPSTSVPLLWYARHFHHVTRCLDVDVQLATQEHVRTREPPTPTRPCRPWTVVRAETTRTGICQPIEAFSSPIMARCPLHLAGRGEIIKRVECRRRRSALRERGTRGNQGGERGNERGNESDPPGYVSCARVATRRRVIESIGDLLPTRAARSDD